MEMRASGETELFFVRRAAFLELAQHYPDAWLAIAQLASLNQVLSIAGAGLDVQRPDEMASRCFAAPDLQPIRNAGD